MRHIISLLVACVILCGLSCHGVSGQDLALTPDSSPGTEPAVRRALDAAQRAKKQSRLGEARYHLRYALARAPGRRDILQRLIDCCGDDQDARRLATWDLLLHAANARGKVKLSGKQSAALLHGDESLLPAVALASSAMDEVASVAASLKAKGRSGLADAITLAWIHRLAEQLAPLAPAAARKAEPAFLAAKRRLRPQYKIIMKGLLALLSKAEAKKDLGQVIEIARLITGLQAQNASYALQGKKSLEVERAAGKARASLDKARRASKMTPLSAEELRNFSKAEALAFTESHASWANPGVAISEPKGLYRVETTCGFETLLGVAESVELHHERLVSWYGSDPFANEQGIVRVVPEQADMEAESTPHWWAGGFQSGSLTTVKFQCGTIPGLGRTLTHELTHRFDGRFHAGLPSWLAEGRAVWTGSAYGSMEDKSFVARHCNFRTVESAYIKGYANERNLDRLLKGTIADYRDNYPVGYALWLFLSRWEIGGKPAFASRIPAYLKGTLPMRNRPVAWFLKHFADGKNGRPKDKESFVKEWDTYLRGFYWQNRAPWTSKLFTQKTPPRKYGKLIYDRPIWTRALANAEPHLGTDQAGRIARMLLERGQLEAGLAAAAWALTTDPWSSRIAREAITAAQKLKIPEVAWVIDRMAKWHEGEAPTEDWPAGWQRKLVETLSLLDGLKLAALAQANLKLPMSAAAIRSHHDQLARVIGRPILKELRVRESMLTNKARPFDSESRLLSLAGYEETSLVSFDEKRVKDLWYSTDEGDLVVGRKKPREGTGTLDPRAHQRDAFAKTKTRVRSGTYRIKTRVHFTTSFVRGAVILGHSRRDRHFRVNFRAGDFLYSIGAKEKAVKMDRITISLGARRIRDNYTPLSTPATSMKFETPRSSFLLELLVDGPVVEVIVEEQSIGFYHTADGLPVGGHLGLAMAHGAARMEAPLLERLDRSSALEFGPLATRPLDLAKGPSPRMKIWPIGGRINRPLRGLPARSELPDPSENTIVIYVPAPPPPEEDVNPKTADEIADDALFIVTDMIEDFAPLLLKPNLIVAVPGEVSGASLANLKAELGKLPRKVLLMTHQIPASKRDQAAGSNRNHALLVDTTSALRSVMSPITSFKSAQGGFKRWLMIPPNHDR